MTHDELVTLINSMISITWEDDDTVREVLSSVASKSELDKAFREVNNPISMDMEEKLPDDNAIRGYFQ